jgi:anti-sigma-K factor RskA
MSRQSDRERLFSENVDRILAGESPAPNIEMDTDFRTALDFATRMAGLAPSLRPEFQDELQVKLRDRLAELEEKARIKSHSGRLLRWIRQPAWQVMAGVVVLFIIGVVLWIAGVFQPQTVTTPSILGVTAATSKSEYSVGEDVGIRVRLKNITSTTLTIKKYPPILSVMDSDTGQPVYTTIPGESTIVLAAGMETSFNVQWDQRNAIGLFVSPGRYYLELEDIDNQGQPVELDLPSPVYFRID